MVLTIMTMAENNARVIDVKAAFLKGELKSNKEIYMKILEGLRNSTPNKTHGYNSRIHSMA